MKTKCINEELSKKIIENACNKFELNDSFREKDVDPDRYTEIKTMQSQHPEIFEMYPFPSVWCRENELNTYVDAPMHLLFLGITRHLAKYIQEWIALK